MKDANVIYFDEMVLKMAIDKTYAALMEARTLISEGVPVPEEIILRLENIIVTLEEKLLKLVEDEEE
jgi:hypothetical protein